MHARRIVYGFVVFLSAFLLFTMEPLAAKRLLPLLGGSSAVWITCLVFFQAALLVGYLYASWMARQNRVLVHFIFLLAALLVLVLPLLSHAIGSLGVTIQPAYMGTLNPVRFIFGTLALTIGLPFVTLSSTNPLMQVWYVRGNGQSVPYWLFALSNAGSLVALALYPTLVEPHLRLGTQQTLWAVGFSIYLVAVFVIARQSPKSTTPSADMRSSRRGSTLVASRVRALWFLLPLAASAQLAAVTAHLTQDVASIPLLWVLPLGVYLLSFIVAFQSPGAYRRSLVARLLIVLLAAIGYALSRIDTRLPVGVAVLFYMTELFVACLFCHAETYELRPGDADTSISFYVTLAAGGTAGTCLVAIVSPLVFRANYDLPLAFLVTAVLAASVLWDEGWTQRLLWSTVSVLLLATTIAVHIQFRRNALMQTRNFYGSLRVTASDYDDGSEGGAQQSSSSGLVRSLMNGRIRHGTQMMSDEEHRRMPTTYYGTDSGVGIALRNCCNGSPRRVGVVGLGAGTLAAYGQPGDWFRFYEINPLVEPIARNLFTYLRDSRATVSVQTGDGRLSMQREPANNFDVIVVDAFTGDAIPLHLLTREAIQVYRRQLTPAGVMAFHVSNSYVDLAPQIAQVADSEGLEARRVESFPVPAEGAYRATWVLVTANRAFFEQPSVKGVANSIRRRPDLRVWTDDYSSLLPILRLGR